MLLRIFISGVLIMSATAGTAVTVRGALLEGIPVYARLEHADTSGGIELAEDGGPAVVGAGVEFTNFGAGLPPLLHSVHMNIDVSDTQIVVTAVNDQPLSEKEQLFINVDPFHVADVPPITGVRLNPATTWAGFIPFRASVNLNQFLFNMTGLTASAGQQIVLDIIPEPGSGALAAAAGAGLAAVGRRRKT